MQRCTFSPNHSNDPLTNFKTDNILLFSSEVQHLSADELLQRCTYQGQDAMIEDVKVMDPATMVEVPADGTTMGEVMLKGNVVMKGYFKNPAATYESFENGWFHSGDLAVNHGNGRFEIKDRSKGKQGIDVITVQCLFNVLNIDVCF